MEQIKLYFCLQRKVKHYEETVLFGVRCLFVGRMR
jgi:hypothetical protein